MNIVKEEPALGGLSVEYTNYPDIRKCLADILGAMRRRPWGKYDLTKLTKYFSHDLAALWKIHAFQEGNRPFGRCAEGGPCCYLGSFPALNTIIISLVRLKSLGWPTTSSRRTHKASLSSWSSMWISVEPSTSQ